MDPRMVYRHLAEADRHIALSSKHIARQIEIIAELESAGHPMMLALDLLGTYRDIHRTFVSHRDTILRQLNAQKAGSTITAPTSPGLRDVGEVIVEMANANH